MSERYKGMILVIISSIGFGMLSLWGKMAYNLGLGPVELLFLRFTAAALIFWAFALLRFRSKVLISFSDMFKMFIQGGLFYALTSILYFYGLQHLPASLTTVLFFLHPVYTFIVTSVLLKQRLSAVKWLALLMTIGGIVMLIGITQPGMTLDMTGVLLMLLAGVGYSGYTLSNQLFKVDCDGVIASLYNITFCAVTMAVFLYVNGTGFGVLGELTPARLGVVSGMAVISTIVGIMLVIQGIRLIGAAEASVYTVFEPLSSTLFACLFLGERLGILQVGGIAMIVAGVLLIQLDRSPAEEDVPLAAVRD